MVNRGLRVCCLVLIGGVLLAGCGALEPPPTATSLPSATPLPPR